MNWYIEVISNYADFSGRARRKEYWYFFLFNVLIGLAISYAEEFAGGLDPIGYGSFGNIYALALLVPSIAVGVRRLHDTGRSGWWFLIIFIPFIGSIILLVLFALAGEVGENKYGDCPRFEPA